MSGTITIRRGRIATNTSSAISERLTSSKFAVIGGVTLYSPASRPADGVQWTAVGIRDGKPVKVHGTGSAVGAVKFGMELTEQESGVWQAVNQPAIIKEEPEKPGIGFALSWDAEPMLNRLERCLDSLDGHEILTAKSIQMARRQLGVLKEQSNG